MQPWQRILFAPALAVLPFSQAQPPSTALPEPPPAAKAPLRRDMVIQGSAKAINYQGRTSTTKVDLVGTAISPLAQGVAKVKNDHGVMRIVAKVRDLQEPAALGGQFLTYVLWGITPEGRATNLGEVAVRNGKAKVEATEGMQTFGLVITAEPYFAVARPSEAVVMENAPRKDAKDAPVLIDARYELLRRDQYNLLLGSGAAPGQDGRTLRDVLQARNAIGIARATGAPALAGEAFGKAEALLAQAEATGRPEPDRILSAREAVQRAEDARLLTLQRQEGMRMAKEKKLIEERLEEARKEAARAAAAEVEARKMAQTTRMENEQLRSELMEQLNAVLETRDTARGLIVSMNGVLFGAGRAGLTPPAREKLAKIAGILAAHKGLKIEADGYTDSSGTEAFNRSLSEKRAMAAKDFLVSQGVPEAAIVFKGLGPDNPIASNDSEAGRKENRRVELVVTGEGVTH